MKLRTWCLSCFVLMGLGGVSLPVQAFPQYANGEGFRGAGLMSQEERRAHVARLQAMTRFDECRSYMDEHERVLQSRAQASHQALPPMGGDPCSIMRMFGRVR